MTEKKAKPKKKSLPENPKAKMGKEARRIRADFATAKKLIEDCCFYLESEGESGYVLVCDDKGEQKYRKMVGGS